MANSNLVPLNGASVPCTVKFARDSDHNVIMVLSFDLMSEKYDFESGNWDDNNQTVITEGDLNISSPQAKAIITSSDSTTFLINSRIASKRPGTGSFFTVEDLIESFDNIQIRNALKDMLL